MRLAKVSMAGRIGLAVPAGENIPVAFDTPLADLDATLSSGDEAMREAARLCAAGVTLVQADVSFLPPLVRPPKIVCVGLNYQSHADESGFTAPAFPTLFARYRSSLIGHGAPLIKPPQSEQFDFEGEMVAIIGKAGKDIPVSRALEHLIGYSVFNDASVRDYQLRTTQWTAGKNFDGTGAICPWIVTPDELPTGAAGLTLETRLNGGVVQRASTSDMIFEVATLVSLLSTFMTLECGDILVTGTPAGVGMSRDPPLFMEDGDICEVEIEGIGLLHNPVHSAFRQA